METETNFERTCRTCAECFDDELHPIFVNKNFDIIKMFQGFTGFNFKITEDDELPKSLCNNCSKQLTQIYMFLLQCEKSQVILNKKLQISNVNNKDPQMNYQYKTEETDDNNGNYSSDREDVFTSSLQNYEKNDRKIIKQERVSLNIQEQIKKCYKSSEDDSSILHKDKTKFQKKIHNLRKRKKKNSIKNKDDSKDTNENKLLVANNKMVKKDYECNVCTIKFDKFANLREHKKEKHPAQPITFLCDVCGKKFNKRDRLLQHKNRHSGFKPFKCDICGKCFSIKGSLRSHVQRHVNPENFKCGICGKTFLIRKCYEEHVRRHESGEKLFKCPYCPRTFKLLSTLTHHCTFHNKTLDKKYHCTECNTNFRRSDHLKEHINGVHLKILPFKCELCPQAFVTGAKRNIHVKRMHSGKRYQCNQCEKDFSLPSSLNRHKKGHSGVKSLICEICNESFVTPIQIRKHMETHELDEVAKNNLITQTYEKIKNIAINQDEINDSKIF